MKWKQEYATGISEVDRQHKALFEAVENFRDVMNERFGKSSYPGFLEFLALYVDTHFSYEEGCMVACKCPIADRNKMEHAQFLEIIRNEEATFRERGYERQRVQNLLEFMDDWLDSHICRVDIQLKDYVD